MARSRQHHPPSNPGPTCIYGYSYAVVTALTALLSSILLLILKCLSLVSNSCSSAGVFGSHPPPHPPAPSPQEQAIREAREKAEADAVRVRQELKDQYLQQEAITAEVRAVLAARPPACLPARPPSSCYSSCFRPPALILTSQTQTAGL